mgnify:CR=1 FL=1
MNKIKPKFLLKDQLFNKQKVKYLSKLIKNVFSDFLSEKFEKEILEKFCELELKERIYHISDILKKYLPDDFEKSVNIMINSLPEIIENWTLDNNFWDFIFVPYCDYIRKYWCTKKYLDFSLDSQWKITPYASAEDSIRYFLNKFEDKSFKKLLEFSKSKNYYIRRLASEWTRPKLPWCQKIYLDYKKTIVILDNLYFDKSRFVTRSVANHLNDISKIDPNLVIDTLKKWKKSNKSKDIDYIISHSTRTLVKLGDKNTLEFLGYSTNPQIEIKNFNIINPEVIVWKNLELEFEIIWNKKENLIIDYKIYFIWKNWKLLPKVFKIKKINFTKNINIFKKHPLKIMTTKKLFEWIHFVEIQINWISFWKKEFRLVY